MPERQPDLKIDIIAPSAYDDNGILKQYSRILMLAPAFAVLDSITDKAAGDYGLDISVAHHNERLERGDDYLRSIIKDGSAHNSVVFITAKSFEIPRAIDIARELRRAGKQVVLGGPGVTLADCKTYQYLVEEGIPFNVGEGENTVPQIIQDVVNHQLRPVYWQRGFVDMRHMPLPQLPIKNEHKRMTKPLIALDTSEGCPFGCSFCSVIKIRGRKISADRSRSVDACVEWIGETHARGFEVFLIDDNFRLSHTYQALKRPLTLLNEDLKRRGEDLYLFVQLDARPDIIKEAEVLAAMGVKQAFFGMESLDPQVLAASQKKHNNPEFYRDIVDEFHKYGIEVGSGVMVGFPSQTPESIHEEMRKFSQLVDLAHNYAVVPMPGTDDYLEAVRKGQLVTWDLNSYDGTHFVRDWFKNMTLEDAAAAYRQSFFDLFPLRNISPTVRLKNRLYGRGLAELGNRFYGRPFHIMMDGIPYIPPLLWIRTRRPVDGFTGFALEPDDIACRDPKSSKEEKARYLSQIAWSPQEVVAA